MARTKRQRSALLPVRHDEPDLFICDILDATPKGDRASMEHPLFSLSTKKDMRPLEYENGRARLVIEPSHTHGRANIFDRDILIYILSQLMAAQEEGHQIGRRVSVCAHDLLQATNRHTSGQAYATLKAALTRLQFTQIQTNIHDHGIAEWRSISFVTESRITKEDASGRMLDIEVEIGDWLVKAVENKNVLTLNKRYFQLRKPLERRLYELARKHCGSQPEWRCGLDKLQIRTGSISTPKEFKRLVKAIAKMDEEEDHMPDYTIRLVGDVVYFRPKEEFIENYRPQPKQDTLSGAFLLPLRPDTLEAAREAAPGWDVRTLVTEWRSYSARQGEAPRNPDKAFLGFCKGWYKQRGRAA